MEYTTFVGLDVHKRAASVAIAEWGRGGEVRFLGEIPSTPEALHRLVERLKGRHRQLSWRPPITAFSEEVEVARSPEGHERDDRVAVGLGGRWPMPW